MAVTNFDEYRDVFVVADTIDDVVHPVTYELIGQARRIAKELGQLVQVMLLGENVQTEAEELVAHGADIVWSYAKRRCCGLYYLDGRYQ